MRTAKNRLRIPILKKVLFYKDIFYARKINK